MEKQQDEQPAQNETSLMCEFQNHAEQEHYCMKRDIYIKSNPTFREQKDPNPNQYFRLVRRIFQNYSIMLCATKSILNYLINYHYALTVPLQIKKLQDKKLVGELTAQQQNILSNLIVSVPSMIVNKIVLLKEREQKQAIMYAINKLKLMVIKARYKQSTSLDYLIDSYITKLKMALTSYIKFKEEKSQKNKIIELNVSRHEFIITALTTIKNKFDVIDYRNLRYYKLIPNDYLNHLKKGTIKQQIIFFINFYTETLLYVDREYIGINQNLLYCPVIAITDNCIALSQQYLKNLTMSVCQWPKHQFYIQIYHIDTSLKIPIFYSNFLHSNDSFGLHDNRNLPQRWRKEQKNLQKMLKNISMIRKCVFVRMIMQWMLHIFSASQKQVEITIQNKFKIIIRQAAEPVFYEHLSQKSKEEQPQFRSELVTNLLLFLKDKRHLHQSKQFIREQICTLLSASLFKIVAQKTGTRVSWPLECGSLGNHYYEYVKDKPLQRGEVSNFLSNM